MKRVICIVIATVMAFATFTAQAMDVQQYILNTMPGISQQEAAWCADAHRNGGEFIVKIHDVTLRCSKNTLIKDWDLTSD